MKKILETCLLHSTAVGVSLLSLTVGVQAHPITKDVQSQVDLIVQGQPGSIPFTDPFKGVITTRAKYHIQGMAVISDEFWIATHSDEKKGRLQILNREDGEIIDTYIMDFNDEGYPSGAQAAPGDSPTEVFLAVTTGSDGHVRFYRVHNTGDLGEEDISELTSIRLNPKEIEPCPTDSNPNRQCDYFTTVENVGFARHPVNRHYYVVLTQKRGDGRHYSHLYVSDGTTLSNSTTWTRVNLNLSSYRFGSANILAPIPFAEAGIALIFEKQTNDMFVFSLGATRTEEDEDSAFAVTKITQSNPSQPRSDATAELPQFLELKDGDGNFRWGGTAFVNGFGQLSIVAAPRKINSLGAISSDFGLWTVPILPPFAGAVSIDCGVDGIDYESTTNTISASFFDKDGILVGSGTSNANVDCDSEEIWISTPLTDPAEYVQIATDGDDGFMIDLIKLSAGGDSRQSGANNDKGWCLSTDPDDDTRSWVNAVGNTSCEPRITWTIPRNPTNPNVPDHLKNPW